jgi:N-acyl-D-amino-acid deacylase
MRRHCICLAALCIVFLASCTTSTYDTIITNGMVYDGNGGEPYQADIGIRSDTIAYIGDLRNETAKQLIDAKGMAVSPGFINMLSWAPISLIIDGNSQGDIRQGVTLEVFGEGESMGPLNAVMKKEMQENQGRFTFDVTWNTLGEYMEFLQQKGIATNIASYVGAATIRTHVIGEDNRAPTPEELVKMQDLVRAEMKAGALGVGSSLIYPPAFFAKTEELIALCKVAGEYGGGYISHMRSEGNRLIESVQELIRISRESNVHGEIYHLKAGGVSNWPKMDSVISIVEAARANGIDIAANMYVYTAGATGLTATMPPSLQDGGFGKLWQRLQDPGIRMKMKQAIQTNSMDWENLYYGAGSPEKILLLEFRRDSLFKYAGKTLGEVARMRNTTPADCIIDLIIQDSSRVGVAFYLMSEDNIRKQIALPWVSFGSDAESASTDSIFMVQSTHPRAYGNFARVIGHYVREEKVITLQEAIRKLSKVAATSLRIKKRGELKVGHYADVLVFDPLKVQDHATFDKPRQYATGMVHVFVNGVQVLKEGEHTNAKPGRFVKGPGFGR